MKSLVGVITLVLLCTVWADNENARLLASKNILNQYMVENKDLTIEYEIYNVGGRYVLSKTSLSLILCKSIYKESGTSLLWGPYSAAFVNKLSTQKDKTDLYIPIFNAWELAICVLLKLH